MLLNIKEIVESSKKSIFEIYPLNVMQGYTVGTALRRALFNSVAACSIIAIKIEGISHEYASVNGTREDLLHINNRLRTMPIRILEHFDEPISMTVNFTSEERIVKCKDMPALHNIEFPDPEYRLFELVGSGDVSMTMWFGCGVGSDPDDKFFAQGKRYPDFQQTLSEFGVIRIIPNFSRVSAGVNVTTSDQGGMPFEILTINVESDGGQSPKKIFDEAKESLFQIFEALNTTQIGQGDQSDAEEYSQSATFVNVLSKSLNSHEIMLNPAIVSSLEAAGFEVVRDLIEARSLKDVPGMSQDVIEKIRKALQILHNKLDLNQDVLSEYQLL
jgi:DNA-directed RNA polymerase subunit alpha